MYLLDETKVNGYLNISGQTTLVEDMIDIVESYIHSFCNVKTFNETTEEIEVKFKSNGNYQLNYPNIIDLSKINGEIYTGVYGTDYKIKNKRNLLFATFDENYEADDFGDISFEITYGYDNTTQEYKDLQNAALLLVESVFTYTRDSQSGNTNKNLKSITIGDISKSYGNPNGNQNNGTLGNGVLTNISKAEQILNKYKILNIFSN